MEEEIWKDVPGYEGHYQVSNMGRVRSIRRIVSDGKSRKIAKDFDRRELANRFGVTVGTITSVILKKTWGFV